MPVTADQVNAEVTAFVRCSWPVHLVVDVTMTANQNVTDFLNNEAKVRFSTRGNLHHETCHLIIEKLSTVKRIEECTKEGTCDAYKFLKMQENGVGTYDKADFEWYAKIDQYKNQTIKTILSSSGDKSHDIFHGIPASRILRRYDTLDRFRVLVLLGISAEDITDPDLNFSELLRYCWSLQQSMNGKNEDEKWKIKQQIDDRLSRV
jgi:hypothetical protein